MCICPYAIVVSAASYDLSSVTCTCGLRVTEPGYSPCVGTTALPGQWADVTLHSCRCVWRCESCDGRGRRKDECHRGGVSEGH